jgi:hypothetical protein
MFNPAKLKAARMFVQFFSVALIGYVSCYTGHQLWPIPDKASAPNWLVFSFQWVILVAVIQSKNPRFRQIQEEAEYEMAILGNTAKNEDRKVLLKKRMHEYILMPLILAVGLAVLLFMLG